MNTEPCLCGDPLCPICGSLMGTYPEDPESDPEEYYEIERQKEVDGE